MQDVALAVGDARSGANVELGGPRARDGARQRGILILCLAAIGINVVVSFAWGRRTSEIAVRMAGGAARVASGGGL